MHTATEQLLYTLWYFMKSSLSKSNIQYIKKWPGLYMTKYLVAGGTRSTGNSLIRQCFQCNAYH